MKLKHTPGPWNIDVNENLRNIIFSEKTHEVICDLKKGVNDNRDARLIACAPEMLELLIEFLEWGAKTSSDMAYFEGNMKIFIEKATGMTIDEVLK